MTGSTALQRVSPLWLGLSVGAFLLGLFFVLESVLGRWEVLLSGDHFDPLARVSSGILRDVRITIVHCLLTGYVAGTLLYTLRSGRRTVLTLQDRLDCTREECEKLAATIRFSKRGLLLAGLVGFALAVSLPYVTPPVPQSPWNPSGWSAEVAWHRILGPIMLVLVAWQAYAVVLVSTRLSGIAKRLESIDLFDLSSLAPFTRLGLGNSLLVIGGLSIFSLFSIETGFVLTVLLFGVPIFIVAVIALLFPVRGVRDRIRQKKDAELQTVSAAISARRDSLLAEGPGQQQGAMADLVAYRGLVEAVPEWPFTTSNYVRFVLYMLIPALSWGLGVVAEELIGRALF